MAEIIDIRELREVKRMTKLEFEARVEYLGGYLSAMHKLRSADLRLEELELDYGPGARPMSGGSGGKKTDGSDRIIRRIEDKKQLTAAVHRHRTDALRRMDEIEAVFDELPQMVQEVMRYCYLNGMDLGQIAQEVKYSYRQVQRFHQRGVMRVRLPRYKIDKIKRELMEEHPEWALLEVKAA